MWSSHAQSFRSRDAEPSLSRMRWNQYDRRSYYVGLTRCMIMFSEFFRIKNVNWNRVERERLIEQAIVSGTLREFLWETCGLCGDPQAIHFREMVCVLIRHHVLPIHLNKSGRFRQKGAGNGVDRWTCARFFLVTALYAACSGYQGQDLGWHWWRSVESIVRGNVVLREGRFARSIPFYFC